MTSLAQLDDCLQFMLALRITTLQHLNTTVGQKIMKDLSDLHFLDESTSFVLVYAQQGFILHRQLHHKICFAE